MCKCLYCYKELFYWVTDRNDTFLEKLVTTDTIKEKHFLGILEAFKKYKR